MRTCKRCRTEKPFTEFYSRTYIAKGVEKICYSHKCKQCAIEEATQNRRDHWDEKYKEYHRKYSSSDPAKRRARECRDRLATLVNQRKTDPCADCGRTFPPVCMDFDHRDPSQKVESVTQLVAKRHRWEVIEAEIAKCDLVCACCHRLRTAKMFGWIS